ncbi:MAG TPA: hypothetical protein VMS77_05515 [Conexivisphaerales archaeon]|nr:hypothetical protein [Conexivisphaerales archaeon]
MKTGTASKDKSLQSNTHVRLPEPGLVYRSGREWGALLFGLPLLLIGTWVLLLVILTTTDISELVSVVGLILCAMVVFLFYMGARYSLLFIRAKRVEFYEDHAMLPGGPKGDAVSMPYSQVDFGELKAVRGFATFHFHFRLSVKSDPSSQGWEVKDGPIPDLGINIYTWLRIRMGQGSELGL